MIPFIGKAQTFHQKKIVFGLFENKISAVEHIKNDELITLYLVDTHAYTVEVFDVFLEYDLALNTHKMIIIGQDTTLLFDPHNLYRRHNKFYALELRSTHEFNKYNGHLRTSYYYENYVAASLLTGEKIVVNDTSSIDYKTSELYNLMTSKVYSNIRKGKKQINRKEYFGYNPEHQLILNIQSEGNLQYHYEYVNNRIIVHSSIDGNVRGEYELDQLNRIAVAYYTNSKIEYSYNEMNLLLSEKHIGKEETYTINFIYH